MIANHKGEIPVVVLLMPFIIGIGLGLNFLNHPGRIWLTIIFCFFCASFVLLNGNYRRLGLYKARWIGGLSVSLILFFFGWLRVTGYDELNNQNHFSKSTAQFLVVKINNEPIFKNGFYRFSAEVEQNVNHKKYSAVSGTLLIAINDRAAKKLYYGDELLIPAKYKGIDPPFIPAAFNYKKYLANQNIYFQTYLYPGQYTLIKADIGNPIIAKSFQLRRHLIEKLKLNMVDTDAIAVASTLILGYKADLSTDIMQAYSKTGTIHVLSVSGAHVAILYLLLAFCLQLLNRFKYGKILKAFIMVSIIGYYALLSGFSPAVCRAALMISLVIIGKTYNRYINILNILAISAFVLLVYDPFFIADVGFQLSYLAVGGLVIFQPIVYKWFTFKNKWTNILWALCSVSVAAQVITFPLSAYYFHQFPVYFLLSNLLITIPSVIIMYAGIFYLLLPQTAILSQFLATVLEKTILVMNKALVVIEHWPFASINKIWLSIPEYLLLYVIIICFFYYLYNKKTRFVHLGLVCTLMVCVSLSIKRVKQCNAQTIAWLNLNKHQTIVFKNGNDAVVLSDLKPADKTWRYAIQPYLDSCQITNTRYLDFNQGIHRTWFIKNHNFIQFLSKRIFIFNGQYLTRPLIPKLKTDYIYTPISRTYLPDNLSESFDFNLMVINGSNNSEIAENGYGMSGSVQLKYKILKSNNSLITLSN